MATNFIINPKDRQYVDVKRSVDVFSTSEYYGDKLVELFEEFLSDKWGGDTHDVETLGDVHQGFENVTENLIKERFKRTDFSDWNGSD